MSRALTVVAAALASLLLGCGKSEEATANPPDPFYGVTIQDAVSDAEFSRMALGRVGSYHLVISWAAVERNEGLYDWVGIDKVMTQLAINGIKPVPYVFATPAHLADDVIEPPTDSPEALAAWARFLREAAARYGPGGSFWQAFALTNPGVAAQPLEIWEIWNEVNGPAFWSPKPSPFAYARLLRVSDRALHSIDPEAEIMTAGMFATPSSRDAIVSFKYLRRLYQQDGIAEIVDDVGIHPYGPRIKDVAKQMRRTRKVMRRAGDASSGLWVTEIGWGSDPSVRSPLAKSRRKQAKLLTQAYGLFRKKRAAWKVQGALWYNWRDPNGQVQECTWCAAAGLFERDLDPKPSWVAFTRQTGGTP